MITVIVKPSKPDKTKYHNCFCGKCGKCVAIRYRKFFSKGK